MIPVVFINCRRYPFIGLIRLQLKLYETRTRNTLAALVGQRVILAETGRGRPLAGCMATIGAPIVARSRSVWESLRRSACIDAGSSYDWQQDTKVKYLYPLLDVQPIMSFRVPEGPRHGRVWMEYTPIARGA